jgi:hypothetical protein
MIYVVIVGLAGALLMFAGDMLLYYTPEDFAYDSKSSSAEKILSKTPAFLLCRSRNRIFIAGHSDCIRTHTPSEMDVSFESWNTVFAQTGSSTFTKGNSHYCFRWVDKLDFRYILFGCVVRNSIITS